MKYFYSTFGVSFFSFLDLDLVLVGPTTYKVNAIQLK